MIALKTAYDGMSETQKFAALFSDPLTSAHNRRAFELTESNYIAIVDLDSLKWVNDNIGHRAGDTLLCSVAFRLKAEGLDVYRLSGDEFVVRENDRDRLSEKVNLVQNHLGCISVGIGSDLEKADARLRINKSQREKQGLRSPRGICPPWMEIQRFDALRVYGDLPNG